MRPEIRILLLGLLLAACGTAAPAPAAHRLEPLFVMQEVVVGENRFALGLLEDGTPISDGRLQVHFKGPGGAAPLDVTLTYRGDALLPGPGLYVAGVRFERAGDWVAETTASSPRSQPQSRPLPFKVLQQGVVPAVGTPAPRSRNLTARDVPDIGLIDTGVPPNDMHEVSIAQAIEAHRPALVIFATPAFCTSRICGPEVKIVETLEPRYRDRLAFIHVEIYENFRPDPSKRRLTPTVREWHLESEPWVFLIDRQGMIAARFEGPTPASEIVPAIDRIV